ncbi:MAG: radical SAM protein [Candidatus Omnitrophica bacterium]|nr:radical SAM protein [Candidatus Omnitrophota bacterium]
MRINFPELSTQQIQNLRDAIECYREKRLISSSSPPVLYIELTKNCPSRCIFCRPRWNNHPLYTMSKEVFARILEEYISSAVLVSVNGWGESLILPDLDEYIDRIARFGPKIRITTTLGYQNQKALQSFIDNDVFVSVTFDYADKFLYEKNRKGIHYDTVIRNLEFLTREMKKKGTLSQNIRFAVAPLQSANLSQLEKIIAIAAHYGVSEIELTPLFARRINPNLLVYHKKKTCAVLIKCAKEADNSGIRLHLHYSPFRELYFKEHAFDLCCHPWLYGFVNYKGDILFCDHLIFPRYSRYLLGSIYDERERVWNGERVQILRLSHIRRDRGGLPKTCNACYLNGRYADHEHVLAEEFGRWVVTDKNIAERFLCR